MTPFAPPPARRVSRRLHYLVRFSQLVATVIAVVVSSLPCMAAELDLADVRSRLESAQADTVSDPETQSRVVELYRQAKSQLEAAAADRAQDRQYQDSLDSAPTELAALKNQLESPPAPSADKLPKDIPGLERQLLVVQTELLKLREEATGIDAKVRAEQDLDLAALIARALERVNASQERLTAPATSNVEVVAEAERTVRASTLDANNANLDMLQHRQLSHNLRLAKWDAQRRLLNQSIAAAAMRVTTLQDALSAARRIEAGDVAEASRQRVSKLIEAPEQAQKIAAENAALAQDIESVGARIDELVSEQAAIQARRVRVDRYYTSITQQLAVAGAERMSELGDALLQQRRILSQEERVLGVPELLDEEITRAQLNKLRLEDAVQDAELAVDAAGSELVGELNNEHHRLLRDAATAYRRYIADLSETRSALQVLAEKTATYGSLLDSRLFWIPSTSPVSLGMFRELLAEMGWLFAPAQWRQVGSALSDAGLRAVVLALLLLVIAAVIAVAQKPLKQLILDQAQFIGKVNRDQVRTTWLALLLTLVRSLPVLLVLMSLSNLLAHGHGFAAQLSTGLRHAASLWFLLEGFRQVCAEGGLAHRHFQWTTGSLDTVKDNLPWVTRTLVPTALLTPLFDGSDDGTVSDAMSRLLFGVATIALAYFAHRVLRPHSALSKAIAARGSRWRTPIRFVIHPVTLALLLLLLGLSWYGYHFTAIALEQKLFVMACMIVGLVIVYYLAFRSVAVTERRMALEQLLARREAARAQSSNKQAAEEAAEGIPDNIDLPEYDLKTINTQTRSFLRLIVLLLGVIGAWNIWADTLPALGRLDEIVLWQIAAVDALHPDEVVTLADLGLAFLLLFFTYFGARNLPGSLEISVLRNMNLEPGTSYAVTTIARYVIVMVGLVVVLNLIGAQWSKLQWLIAALGVGLGFGLQEIVANFVSGLLILFERPIRVGDTITVGNQTGTVSRIRIRATTLTDWDRKEQIIPNKTFITELLTNWTLSDPITRRIIKVGVAYGSDIELVHKTLSEVVANNQRVIDEPPPAVFFVGFGESSLDFEIRVFVQAMLDLMPVTHELHIAIEKALRENGVQIPFPQRDVWIRTEDDSPPERRRPA